MKLTSLSTVTRPRLPYEAIDLGLKLVQEYCYLIYTAWSIVLLPLLAVAALIIVFFPDKAWSGILLIWWLKPLYERIILFVLSRAVFGESIGIKDSKYVWADITSSGIIGALTWRRLSLKRTFLLPVWQLEKSDKDTRKRRIRVLAGNDTAYYASRLGLACSYFESGLTAALIYSVFMFIPQEIRPDGFSLKALFAAKTLGFMFLQTIAFSVSMLLIEPLYVAGGFALYLNRRTELEAWDIEIGFRQLAKRLSMRQEL
ncbi:MAG: hypothetical protein V4525_04075 [Pseudomonadota bacterium]